MSRLFTDSQEREIARQYKRERISCCTLAKRYGCTSETIRRVVNTWGKIRAHKEAMNTTSYFELQKQNNAYYTPGKNHPSFGKTGERAPMFGKCGEKNSNYKGWRSKTWDGYVLIYKPEHLQSNANGYILEHRLIMEKYLGRYLTKKEIVYHKNSVKDDNRVENLQLFRNQSEYISFQMQNHPGPFKDTKPELKMKEILNDLNIPFDHQFRLQNHIFDFYIPNTNILIEVDGDYFHGNPKKFKKLSERQQQSKEKDIENGRLAKANNYILLRFWESDILKNENFVKEKICNILDS